MYCRFCGVGIQEDSHYCPACGKSLAKIEGSEREISKEQNIEELLAEDEVKSENLGQVTFCPTCSIILSKWAIRCPNCATPREFLKEIDDAIGINDLSLKKSKVSVDVKTRGKSSIGKINTSELSSSGSKFTPLWFIAIFIVIGIFAFLTQGNSGNSSPSSNSNQTNGEGHWVSKCRQVRNPDYNGNHTSVNENLNQPSPWIQQCTDVWVQP